jgi:O-antigen/teichoic acid export membrane protein
VTPPALPRRLIALPSGVPVSLLGGAATGAAMFLVSVLAARLLPPREFANVVFCLALAQLWLVPTVAGLELAGPRHLAAQPPQRRRAAAGSVLALSLTLATAAVLVSLPFSGLIADVTGSPRALVFAALVFGVATGLRAVLERLVAALGLLPTVAVVKLLEGALIVGGTVAVLSRAELRGWLGVVVAVDVAALVAVGGYLLRLRRTVGPLRVERGHLRQVWSFARHAAPSTVFAVALVYVDKFALRVGVDDRTYAVYSVYFAGSLVVAVQAVFVLQSVVLPASVRSASSRDVHDRVLRVMPWLLGLLPAAYLASLMAVLALLGQDYDFRWVYAAPFAVWAAVYTTNLLCLTAVIGRSTLAMRRESRVLAVRTGGALALLYGLSVTGRLDIVATVLVMLSLELVETANVVVMARRYLRG